LFIWSINADLLCVKITQTRHVTGADSAMLVICRGNETDGVDELGSKGCGSPAACPTAVVQGRLGGLFFEKARRQYRIRKPLIGFVLK
jgi:hypothetical protein